MMRKLPGDNMKKHLAGINGPVRIAAVLLFSALAATNGRGQIPSAPENNSPLLPYTPSLDLGSMDRTVDPCVDLYHYACGTWQKKNPIPADQTSWSVYSKLYEDNLNFLRTLLDQAAVDSSTREAVT